MNGIEPYCDDSDIGNWLAGKNPLPKPLCFYKSVNAVQENNNCLIYK
jgi:hypothetical protein